MNVFSSYTEIEFYIAHSQRKFNETRSQILPKNHGLEINQLPRLLFESVGSRHY